MSLQYELSSEPLHIDQVVRSVGMVQGFERRLARLAGRRAERNGWRFVPLQSDVMIVADTTPRSGYCTATQHISPKVNCPSSHKISP